MKSQQAVLDYKYLDGYYTSNGFNSAEYNYAISNPDVSERYSNSVLELYRNHHSLLCDYTGSDEAQGPMGASRPYYVPTDYYCKQKLYKGIFQYSSKTELLWKKVYLVHQTVLIPNMYKNDESLIKEHIAERI